MVGVSCKRATRVEVTGAQFEWNCGVPWTRDIRHLAAQETQVCLGHHMKNDLLGLHLGRSINLLDWIDFDTVLSSSIFSFLNACVLQVGFHKH